MNPIVLARALAQPIGTRAMVLAAAFTGGTTRVTFDGRTLKYRWLDELGRALSVLHAVENTAARRPVSPWPASPVREPADGSSSRCLARIPYLDSRRDPPLPDAVPGAA